MPGPRTPRPARLFVDRWNATATSPGWFCHGVCRSRRVGGGDAGNDFVSIANQHDRLTVGEHHRACWPAPRFRWWSAGLQASASEERKLTRGIGPRQPGGARQIAGPRDRDRKGRGDGRWASQRPSQQRVDHMRGGAPFPQPEKRSASAARHRTGGALRRHDPMRPTPPSARPCALQGRPARRRLLNARTSALL